MNRSLRKGTTRLYFQHANTGHNIRAKFTESELKNDLAILRFTLSPMDDNQKNDEGHLHNEKLESASTKDDKIINGFMEHIKHSSVKVSSYKVELLSRGEKLEFDVTPTLNKQGNLRTLCLTVNNG